MQTKTVTVADLFCGAGGTSSGCVEACKELGVPLDLVAVNHWDIAVATHTANHTNARHLCADLESVNPTEIVPGGRLNLLVASPECTGHSNARGGKPTTDQKRASAWYIVNWASKIYIDHILIENVREWRDWGPLNAKGRPIKSKRGQFFLQFVKLLETMDYRVEWRILNAADYGEATTRHRLFLQASKKHLRKEITWPEPTHRRFDGVDQGNIFSDTRQPWRPARDIIDWEIPSKSIFDRKKPLAINTLNRIASHFRKHGVNGEPFLVILRNHMASQSVDEPLPTLTAGGNHVGVCEPFVLGQQSGSVGRAVSEPVPTVATGGAIALVQPFLTSFHGHHDGQSDGDNRNHSINQPMPTQPTANRYGLVEPALIPLNHGKDDHRSHPVSNPLPTQTSADTLTLLQPCLIPFFGERPGQEPRSHSIDSPLPAVTSHGAGALVEPFLTTVGGTEGQGRNGSPVSQPMGTVLTNDRRALVEPFIMPANHGDESRSHDINQPMPTITAFDSLTLVETELEAEEQAAQIDPFICKFYGTGVTKPVNEPLDTITAKDRFGLVEIDGKKYKLDIKLRMLHPQELAAAMGFRPGYKFTGSREDVVKQVGNAVSVKTAKALITEILTAGARQNTTTNRDEKAA